MKNTCSTFPHSAFATLFTLLLLPFTVLSVGCEQKTIALNESAGQWSFSTEATTSLHARTQHPFRQGFQAAQALVGRIQDQTLSIQGCDGLEDFERGLSIGISTVQIPLGLEMAKIARFTEGELYAVALILRQTQENCSLSLALPGHFVGAFIGALVCQSLSVHPTAIHETSWNGLFTSEVGVCRQSFERIIARCGHGILSDSEMLTQLDSICRT